MEETSLGGYKLNLAKVWNFLCFWKYFLIPIFQGETRAELHIDQANVGQSVLQKETQYIKLFKSLFVIFAINYKLLEV